MIQRTNKKLYRLGEFEKRLNECLDRRYKGQSHWICCQMTCSRTRGNFCTLGRYWNQSNVSTGKQLDDDSRVLAPLGPLFPSFKGLAIQIY